MNKIEWGKVMRTKEAIEFLENFLKNNPYPEDVFTPIPKEDYTKINNLLKKEMGYPIDRLFGNMGRKIYQTIGEDLKPIISLLQQGMKYKKIVEHLEKHCGYYYYGSSDNLSSLIPRLKQEHLSKGGEPK